jgi:thiosulfate reductase cytochrome b subunit
VTAPADAEAGPATDTVWARPKHSLARRWMHWVNFPLLLVMLWSGLRIYDANDTHAIDVFGVRFDFFPLGFFEFFEAHRRLAKGIAYHLTFGWLFVLNGLAFVITMTVRRTWRELVPDRAALRDLPATVAHDLRLRREAPAHGKYNAAQQLAYTLVIVMGAVMVASGFAIYKPTQLQLLTMLMGGYETARLIHFTTALGLVAFFFLHIVQVLRAGWRNFASMVTGYQVVGPRRRLGRDGDGGSG